MVTDRNKDMIVQKLRNMGCRITRQRLMLLDIILEEDCSSCKEIYYKASKIDKNIGTATVYRMINTLEEIGAISRRNMYRIACGRDCEEEKACTIELEDDFVFELSAGSFNQVIQEGLKACGYIKKDQKVKNVLARTCSCGD